MSTTVPYWSNMHTLIRSRSSAAVAMRHRVRALPRHDPAVLRDEALPGRGRGILGRVDEGGGVDVDEPAVVDHDPPVDEDRLHVLRVGVVDEVLDRIERRRETE